MSNETREVRVAKHVQAQVAKHVQAQVAVIANLTDEQRAAVVEIAEAFAIKNHLDPDQLDPKNQSIREPNYEGIANLVRSRS